MKTHPVPTSMTQAGTVLAILRLFDRFLRFLRSPETLYMPANTPLESLAPFSTLSVPHCTESDYLLPIINRERPICFEKRLLFLKTAKILMIELE